MKGQGTLAARLGTTVHKSVLLRRFARRGLKTADSIAREAQRRGLDYYMASDAQQVDTPISDTKIEELVVALIHPCLPWEPQRFRLAAALMAAPEVNADLLAALAIQERAASALVAIARAGREAEPEEAFWKNLLARLLGEISIPSGVMPHPSRYMVIPGKVRPGTTGRPHWVRPRMLPEG